MRHITFSVRSLALTVAALRIKRTDAEKLKMEYSKLVEGTDLNEVITSRFALTKTLGRIKRRQRRKRRRHVYG